MRRVLPLLAAAWLLPAWLLPVWLLPAWPAAAQDAWARRGVAELTVLDKVRAQATPVSVPVGQSVTFHSLTIKVLGCAVRPPDQAPDATAFVDITDSTPGAPGLRGWILANEPFMNMLQHPIYDVRVTGCR